MCDDYIEIDKRVTESNDKDATAVRKALKGQGVKCINLLGSPGSGKTTLIENAFRGMEDAISVIQGDLESDVDKQRLQDRGMPTYQINTHSGCHLNAHMIRHALEHVNLKGRRLLVIENVGNLVCPVGIDLGQAVNVLAISTTEGTDKPEKYPHIFRYAGIICVTKIDLAPHVDFDIDKFKGTLLRINPGAKVFQTTSKDKESFRSLADYLIQPLDHHVHYTDEEHAEQQH